MQKLEHGTTRPYRGTVQRLALALALSPDDEVLFWAAGQPAPRQRPRTSRPPISPEPSYRHNLPTPLTSFIGRERELAEVHARLAGARLVTLTGVGGCGKTRLALEASRSVLDVEHILNKLGFASRTQIGVWAAEHGLVVSSSA